MVILSHPDSLTLSGNIKNFIISSTEVVRFSLYKNQELLLDTQYHPDASERICIDVRDIVHNSLKYKLESSDFYIQDELAADFRAVVNDQTVTFRAIKCGVSNLSTSASAFLLGNFLSWQPESIETRYVQPQWLTYCNTGTGSVSLCVRFYKDATIVGAKKLNNIQSGKCATVNLQFARVWALATEDRDGYFDVYIEDSNGNRLTYVQRYILSQNTPEDKFFLFENTLGGLDSVVFTGANVFNPDGTFGNSLYDGQLVNTHNDISRIYTQYTGYKSPREILWLKDFWTSMQRYVINDGGVFPIVIEDSSINASSMDPLQSFEFRYKLSSDEGYQNLARTTELATPLEIITPSNLFFFSS